MKMPPYEVQAKIVSRARAMVEQGDEAPEGIEFWRWLWVHGDEHQVYWPKPLEQGVSACGDLPPPHASSDEWTIRPTLHFTAGPLYGGCGWEREAALAIVFFGNPPGFGVPIPRTAAAGDGEIRTLADEGAAIRGEESRAFFRAWYERLMDGEGEEWKNSP